jgi:dephospho-CoA kinase
MRVVGITGGVGSGKTEVAREFEKLGAFIIDADEIARELVDENQSIRKALRKRFGSGVFDDKGRLKRRELGRIVFSDTEKLQQLNGIIRLPLISEIKRHILRLQKKDPNAVVVVDMAIIFEAQIESLFDTIIVVTAPEEKRIQWLSDERGWSPEEISARMQAQMDVRIKEDRADFIIENAGTVKELRQKAKDIYTRI